MSPCNEPIRELALSGTVNSICTYIGDQRDVTCRFPNEPAHVQFNLSISSNGCMRMLKTPQGERECLSNEVSESLREFVANGYRRGPRVVRMFVDSHLPSQLDAYVLNSIEARGSCDDPIVFQIIVPKCYVNTVVSSRLRSVCLHAHFSPTYFSSWISDTPLPSADMCGAGLASYKKLSRLLQRRMRGGGSGGFLDVATWLMDNIPFSISDNGRRSLIHDFADIQHASLSFPLCDRIEWACDGMALSVRSVFLGGGGDQ